MELYQEIKELVEFMETDMSKFYLKGNKEAGKRARAHLQALKVLCQKLRVEIQDLKDTNVL